MKQFNMDDLWKYFNSMSHSPSHDIQHINRVVGFAHELQSRMGGDLEVITAAAILHDIGRANVNLPSAKSAEVAAEEANKILQSLGFPQDKIELVYTAISQHDQPKLEPDTIEGKILKEADFLAGFGAWGILRIAMFQGERKKTTADVLVRLRNTMRERMYSLYFDESKVFASKEYSFVQLFLSLLDEPPELPEQYAGVYIVFEGISGSGKDTQISLLQKYLQLTLNKEVVLISEPTENYLPLFRKTDSAMAQLHLLVADRFNLANNVMIPALRAGKIVIASRCYLSTLVYQESPEISSAYIHFVHKALPIPNSIFLLDVPEDIAYERIISRGRALGKNEYTEKLAKDRTKYKEVAKDFDHIVKIDGTLNEKDIAKKVIEKVMFILDNKKD